MFRKEVNLQSPLRILDRSIHGGLGRGNLGVVMARAGVGKTAALVQIGLDDLMRDRPVLHVALGQTLEHVECWYDALFEDLATRTNLEERDTVAATVAKMRIIAAYAEHDLPPERLRRAAELFRARTDLQPAAILIDGFDWAAHSLAENAAWIGAFKAYAQMIDAELWMSAQTHREVTGGHPTAIPQPCAEYAPIIDVALFLEPAAERVELRLLKDHNNMALETSHLALHPDTLRLVSDDKEAKESAPLPPTAHTLLSGGAMGSETVFGECAERWGLSEMTFSFDGRGTTRSRGLVMLTEEELAEGAVSPRYVEAQLHRTLPFTASFRKTLQTIWHQVTTASEVFSIGTIQGDGTVRGGTGWAVELARHWHKPVHVFDQDKGQWFSWRHNEWMRADAPKITHGRFCGTGTRNLTDAGRNAIVALFERSFGKK